ncbi:type II toxin-antitoxin system RelE/ParE family toxin [Sulfurimonas sp. MAG313]|nr:type II toxin-antitoxin system RelE/ParE family toxin [Sulfurimonas sp. MAG313]MDF1881380.1 type II toxin-antitoxin system RelE/ParE family toxin [Sulfurimonas sp. MAG313]
MKTEIVFSNKASKNLIKQAKYIFEQTQSISIADKYLNGMKHFIIEILSSFPQSGRPSPEIAKDTRKLVYQGYSIIYKIQSNKIQILVIYRENLPK